MEIKQIQYEFVADDELPHRLIGYVANNGTAQLHIAGVTMRAAVERFVSMSQMGFQEVSRIVREQNNISLDAEVDLATGCSDLTRIVGKLVWKVEKLEKDRTYIRDDGR